MFIISHCNETQTLIIEDKFISGVNQRLINDLKSFVELELKLKINLTKNTFLIKLTENFIEEINDVIEFLESIRIDFLKDESVDKIFDKEKEDVKKWEEEFTILKTLDDKYLELGEYDVFSKTFELFNKGFELKDYQKRAAFQIFLTKKGLDFSVPGSGKTIMAYAAYNALKQKKIVEHILIIGPNSSKAAWRDEYATLFNERDSDFLDLSIKEVSEAKNYFNSSIGTPKYLLKERVFINIDKVTSLKHEIKRYVESFKTTVVLDEAHYIKNIDAMRSKSVIELSRNAEVKIALTGTPAPNGVKDIFNIANFVSPNRNILNPYDFNKLKAVKIGDEVEINNIKRIINPYFTRVSKKSLILKGELKESVSKVVLVEMKENHERIYSFLESKTIDYINEFDFKLTKKLKSAICIRMLQMSANPMVIFKTLDENKLDMIEEYKSEAFSGVQDYENMNGIDGQTMKEYEKYIAFLDKEIKNSEYKKILTDMKNNRFTPRKNDEIIERIKEDYLKKKSVIVWESHKFNQNVIYDQMINNDSFEFKDIKIINGDVTGEERDDIIKDFQRGILKVLIASPATIAESVSLHKNCFKAYYLNKNYNGGNYMQSKDRIHRVGGNINETVEYVHLHNKESIDEDVYSNLEEKEKIMLSIIDNEIIGSESFIEEICNNDNDVEDIFKRYA